MQKFICELQLLCKDRKWNDWLLWDRFWHETKMHPPIILIPSCYGLYHGKKVIDDQNCDISCKGEACLTRSLPCQWHHLPNWYQGRFTKHDHKPRKRSWQDMVKVEQQKMKVMIIREARTFQPVTIGPQTTEQAKHFTYLGCIWTKWQSGSRHKQQD